MMSSPWWSQAELVLHIQLAAPFQYWLLSCTDGTAPSLQVTSLDRSEYYNGPGELMCTWYLLANSYIEGEMSEDGAECDTKITYLLFVGQVGLPFLLEVLPGAGFVCFPHLVLEPNSSNTVSRYLLSGPFPAISGQLLLTPVGVSFISLSLISWTHFMYSDIFRHFPMFFLFGTLM